MYSNLTGSHISAVFFLAALLAGATAHAAERMAFSYRFFGNALPDAHPWEPGAKLTGQIVGTIDPENPDLVIINAFGPVALNRPGLDLFFYDDIDDSEFKADPAGATPVMSFSGTILEFRSCPGGFTLRDTCSFASDPGGGFLMTYRPRDFAPEGFATAADGTGEAVCPGPFDVRGCRVVDHPPLPENWGLVPLPVSAVVHPSVSIGTGSKIRKDVMIDEGAELGKYVSVNKGALIGAYVIIGDNSQIKKGVFVCPGISVGSAVTIGKNRLVDTDVPDGAVMSGTDELPNPADCP